MGASGRADRLLSRVYADYARLGKYFAVGAVGTAAEWSLYALLVVLTPVDYLAATAVAYGLGMVVNYLLNRRFTFRSTSRRIPAQFAAFAAIALVGLGIQELVMAGIVGYAFHGTASDAVKILAKVVATFIGFGWTFIGNKRITFSVFR